jgi:hypothetical protein
VKKGGFSKVLRRWGRESPRRCAPHVGEVARGAQACDVEARERAHLIYEGPTQDLSLSY